MKKVVKIHLVSAKSLPERLCDDVKYYTPNIEPGDMVILCPACQRKVYMDEPKED